jgi:purine-nucleoside phosphorylase
LEKTAYNTALAACRERLSPQNLGCNPALAIVMGSGFAGVLEHFAIEQTIPYQELPGFPAASVQGHASHAALVQAGPVKALVLCGRSHYYEGFSMAEITFPMRALAAAGITDVLLTNAAGGINPRFAPGDFMLFTDHINFMGSNPLRGQMHLFGDCFLDLSSIYKSGLNQLLIEAAESAGVVVHQGVYAAVCGPVYETPAEIRAYAALGADAVGMSTVPEAIVAHHAGLRVAALSCITNLAAGRREEKISHQEVLEHSSACAGRAVALIRDFASKYQGWKFGGELDSRAVAEAEYAMAQASA